MEDVDLMKQRSERDSATFLIDSSLRDRRFFPTPSEYVVAFSEPVRNVFGIDILDATVPGTMYNIDFNNNTLRYYALQAYDGNGGSSTSAAAHTDFMDAFMIMMCSPRFVMAMDDVERASYEAYLVPAHAVTSSASAPALNMSGSTPTALLVSYEVANARLEVMPPGMLAVFGLNGAGAERPAVRVLRETGRVWFWSRGAWYGVRTADSTAFVELVEKYGLDSDDFSIYVLSSAIAVGATTNALQDVVFTQTIPVRADWAVETNTRLADFSVEWRVKLLTLRIELGNYNIASIASALADAMDAML